MLTKFEDFILAKALAQGGTTPPTGGTGGGAAGGNDVQRVNLDFFNVFQFRGSTENDPEATFTRIVGYVLGWVLVVIALIAFVYLILNGVKYITAGGDAAKATEARTGIINAIIGIVVVIIAYVILRFAANIGRSL